jgi:hypothetical protein
MPGTSVGAAVIARWWWITSLFFGMGIWSKALSAYVNVDNGDAHGAACLVVGFVVHPVQFQPLSHVVFYMKNHVRVFLSVLAASVDVVSSREPLQCSNPLMVVATVGRTTLGCQHNRCFERSYEVPRGGELCA